MIELSSRNIFTGSPCLIKEPRRYQVLTDAPVQASTAFRSDNITA